MNYSDIKGRIRDLGFSDDGEMDDFESLIPNAINRAMQEMSLTVAPITTFYEFEFTDEDDGIVYIDFTDEEVANGFLEFVDVPVMVKRNSRTVYTRFNDFDVEQGTTMVIDATKNKGKFRVFYKYKPEDYVYLEEEISEDEDEPTPYEKQELRENELPLKAQELLPLLASYYIWLDDDETKAVYYFNRYEELSNIMYNNKKPRLFITNGGI